KGDLGSESCRSTPDAEDDTAAAEAAAGRPNVHTSSTGQPYAIERFLKIDQLQMVMVRLPFAPPLPPYHAVQLFRVTLCLSWRKTFEHRDAAVSFESNIVPVDLEGVELLRLILVLPRMET
ncbi:hypothetical protein FOL46_004533, partial [Perkinsus olseni]